MFLLIGLIGWLTGLHIGLDSTVYRAGAVAVLRGEALYDQLTAIPSWSMDLPFTYPPIASVLFTPLTLVPVQLAWALLAAASVLGVAAVLRWTSGPSPLLFLLVFSLEPVWRTIGFGQVNVLLMAMVVFDLLRNDSRWSGVLIGVAAAVKLTPLIFVLHLVVTGRLREAGRALGTFLGLQLLGFLLLPGDSLRFWGSAIFTGNNATGNGYFTNQSFSGVVQRLTGGAPVLAVALSVVCVVVAAVLARRAYLRGEPVVAMLITAGCGVLVSPISWSHHWVWVVPLVALLRSRAALVLVWVVFVGWTMFSPSGNVLLDNLYVLAALVGGAVWWARGRSGVDVRSRVGAGDGWQR
ncbi:MAG: alpha,2-mannosyltransferase [Pseudonocardiales bacterium]|nr:alpha,2-mannosyltransferase [Pseudonocardiales bacterium]